MTDLQLLLVRYSYFVFAFYFIICGK